MSKNDEYTTLIKNFKTVRNKGLAFATLLFLAEAVLFCITSGGLLGHSALRCITLVSIHISTIVAITIVLEAIAHEVEDVNHTFSGKSLRQKHLDAVKKKGVIYFSTTLSFLNTVFGFATLLNYASHYNTWWFWSIIVILFGAYAIGFAIELFLIYSLPKSIEKAQHDINYLIERDGYYV